MRHAIQFNIFGNYIPFFKLKASIDNCFLIDTHCYPLSYLYINLLKFLCKFCFFYSFPNLFNKLFASSVWLFVLCIKQFNYTIVKMTKFIFFLSYMCFFSLTHSASWYMVPPGMTKCLKAAKWKLCYKVSLAQVNNCMARPLPTEEIGDKLFCVEGTDMCILKKTTCAGFYSIKLLSTFIIFLSYLIVFFAWLS